MFFAKTLCRKFVFRQGSKRNQEKGDREFDLKVSFAKIFAKGRPLPIDRKIIFQEFAAPVLPGVDTVKDRINHPCSSVDNI